MISADNIRDWLIRLADVYKQNKDYLTELDAAIGDADHGINLDRGFSAVKKMLEAEQTEHTGEAAVIAEILKKTAMTLIKSVGGASGPLIGTFFLKASGAVKSDTGISGSDFVEILKAGVEGVKMRGHAEEGEKTMLDAWIPAVAAMDDEAGAGGTIGSILTKGEESAKAGMENTRAMKALKGRASYLGERSIGHIDPGAASSYLMIKTLAETVS